MKRFVSLILSVCFLFSINTVSYAANTSSRKASNPVIQSMNDKYHVDFSGMSIDELNKFMKIIQLLLVILQQKYRKVLQVQKDLMWKGRMFHFPILKQPAC